MKKIFNSYVNGLNHMTDPAAILKHHDDHARAFILADAKGVPHTTTINGITFTITNFRKYVENYTETVTIIHIGTLFIVQYSEAFYPIDCRIFHYSVETIDGISEILLRESDEWAREYPFHPAFYSENSIFPILMMINDLNWENSVGTLQKIPVTYTYPYAYPA